MNRIFKVTDINLMRTGTAAEPHRSRLDRRRRGTRRQVVRPLLLAGLSVVALGALADAADAAAVKAAIKKDVLTVTGTSSADAITLRLKAGNPNTLEVDIGADGGADFAFARRKFTAIIVDGGAGRDKLVIDNANGVFTDTELTTLNGADGDDALIGGAGPEKLSGGPGDDSVDGQQGNDTISGGDGADVVQWDPGDGSDAVVGGTGIDRLAFNGSGATENFDLSAQSGGHVRFFRDVANIVMDLDEVEGLDLRPLGRPDTLTVNDLSGTDMTEVRTDLAPFGGGDDGQLDQVIVNGTPGNDTIAVIADGSAVVVQGLAGAVRITGAAPTVDRLTVSGLEGSDTITATPEASALMVINTVP